MKWTKRELDRLWRIMSDPKMRCKCGEHIDRDASFCVTCGTPNPNLSLEEVARQGHGTVEGQRQDLCPSWHSPSDKVVDEETGKTEVDWIRENPFCPFCGTKIEVA